MKKVLVLMSTYNGQVYLKEQIDSIISQVGVHVQLLIRDDGSSDNTVSIIEEMSKTYKNIKLLKGKNLGFAKSFMTLCYEAVNYSDFDYFAFSDQDDFWLPEKLVTAVNKLSAEDNNIPLLYFSNAAVVDKDLNFNWNLLGSSDKTPDRYNVFVRYYMLGCTMVMNYSTISLLNQNKPSKPIEMHDLWIAQTCTVLGKIVYDSKPYILYRQHGKNAAGVSSKLRVRIKRLIKSFKSYQRRHFREYNAKNFIDTYGDLINASERIFIEQIASYKKSLRNKFVLLRSPYIKMGDRLSDIGLTVRILFNIF